MYYNKRAANCIIAILILVVCLFFYADFQLKANDENFPLKLARQAIETYLRTEKTIFPLSQIPEQFQKKAVVFVSLHKEGGLKGCAGTYLPTKENIAQEIIENAIIAATQDPRFSPVEVEELENIDISVYILTEPEPVNSLHELDPKRYGLIVSKDWQRALVLPDLEGIDTVDRQLEVAKQKAGLSEVPLDQLSIQRFTVKHYTETRVQY